MKQLLLRPQFVFGLLLRVGLIVFVLPVPVATWYVPFLEATTSTATLDPWSTWQAANGDPRAFPYGYVMWIAFLPLALVGQLTGLPLALGYGFTLLIADLALFLALRALRPGHDRLLLWVYWLSPIVIVASYLLGFNDIVPVALLTTGLVALQRSRLAWAGVAVVVAVSAKLSMVLALPFLVIYFLHNRGLRHRWPTFAIGAVGAAILTLLPFALSRWGLQTLSDNPEIGKVYNLALPINETIHVFVVPLAYLLLLYATWRVKRLNFDLFFALLGSAFLLVVLLTPASPGWFIWAIPLLVVYQLSGDRFAITFSAVFSLLYLVGTVLFGASDGTAISGLDYAWMRRLAGNVDDRTVSLVQTLLIAVGAVLALRIWRNSVSGNDFFRLSRKPFVIGVAGDSGAGKDTFSDAVRDLFGRHSVTALSGDDYHLWDRQRPMWQRLTHLNPAANDLERFADDVVALTDRKAIQTRHYDHETGRLSRPFRTDSNDIVIASGLHALYLPILRDSYSLSVYLDIDEGLRRYFKVHRDVHVRGHERDTVLESIEKRSRDAERFIHPQRDHADLIFSIRPVNDRMLAAADRGQPLRFALVARSRHGLNEALLSRMLIGICGLRVDVATSADTAEVELAIEGENTAEDIALAARKVCPRVLEFLDVEPRWQDGVTGLMQLVTLSHINQALTKRFL